jgi:hypothetical protein
MGMAVLLAGTVALAQKKAGPKPCCDCIRIRRLLSPISGSDERRLSSQDLDRARPCRFCCLLATRADAFSNGSQPACHQNDQSGSTKIAVISMMTMDFASAWAGSAALLGKRSHRASL